MNRDDSLVGMEEFGIKQVAPNASKIVRAAEAAPVLITRHNRPAVVVVAVSFFEAAVKAMSKADSPPQGVGVVGG